MERKSNESARLSMWGSTMIASFGYAAHGPQTPLTPFKFERRELTVHATAVPGVRALPAKQLDFFGTEVSFLGIVVLLVVILLSWLILKGKTLSLFGYRMGPQFMGLGILLITLWNLIFGALLIGVEVIALKEL